MNDNMKKVVKQVNDINGFVVDIYKLLGMPEDLVKNLPAWIFGNVPNDKTLESFDRANVVRDVTDKSTFGTVRISWDLCGQKSNRKLAEVVVHNLIHVVQNHSGVPAKKSRQHNTEFRDMAEKYGCIAEKYSWDSSNNYGYGSVAFTKKTWAKIKETVESYKFVLTTAEKNSGKNKEKVEKKVLYYVHPLFTNYVKAETEQTIYAKIGDEFQAYKLVEKDSIEMQRVREHLREINRENPVPGARPETFA